LSFILEINNDDGDIDEDESDEEEISDQIDEELDEGDQGEELSGEIKE
jgi:hypothetical protein